MRRLAAAVDPSDVLLLVGAGVVGVSVYLLWSVWVWAYVGAVLVLAGVLYDLGKRRDGDGTRRPRR